MRLITVLNRCTKFKRFVFEASRFDEHGRIMVSLRPRKNSRAACNGCSRVVVEQVPWSTGKHHLTDIYRCFLAQWAKKLSWAEVARSFRTSWGKVYHSVQYVVEYGIAHRRLDQVTALGVDEIQYRKGHHFLTLVYQIDTHRRRLLWLGEKRTKKTLDGGFTELEQEHQRQQEAAGVEEPASFLDQIAFICTDIWKAYLNVIGQRLPAAVHILDRFHIMQHFSKALDKVRAEEARRLKAEGKDPVLSKPLVLLEAQGEPHRHPGLEVVRALDDEPAHRQSLPPDGGLPALLELHPRRLGREIPQALVFPHDEKQDRTDERHRQDAAPSSRAHPQLVQGPKAVQ